MSHQALPLFSEPIESGTVVINGRCTFRIEAERRVVVVAGLPVHHYSAGGTVAEACAMVFLVDGGCATLREVADALGSSDRTVRRHLLRRHEGGMAALARRPGWRPGRRRLPARRLRVIERLKAAGLSNREIARRLKVTEKAIRKQVGPSEDPSAQQLMLPLGGDGQSSHAVYFVSHGH